MVLQETCSSLPEQGLAVCGLPQLGQSLLGAGMKCLAGEMREWEVNDVFQSIFQACCASAAIPSRQAVLGWPLLALLGGCCCSWWVLPALLG